MGRDRQHGELGRGQGPLGLVDDGDVVGPDRVAAAQRLADRLGVVVLLKGDRSVIAPPGGGAWVNPTGS